ncbi:FecR family protein [Sphingomonas lycopersici]|uniref:FecR domain-containing protein n=1 Tax=Sphingomonas lycopersici TaxID=2951807 RepID=A0AA41Z9W7_9SPHN|nr:FecR domain-containing protein [Sphingomonas lycopersici]MCW6536155.1 FecR domain-containing protein [Sphingomonas lycopersici]
MTDIATHIDEAVLDAAIAWHLRQETMGAADWAAFTAWLEADAAHARAYDAVSLADATRHPAAVPAIAANDDEAPVRWWRRGRGVALAAGALAAAIAGAVGLREAGLRSPAPVTIAATTPRAVTLGDGTRIALAAGARVEAGARSATLESGRATFRVTHDADHPFTVRAGAWEIQDVGTVFAVTHDSRGVDVSVTEGAVLFDPRDSRIALAAGDALSVLPGNRVIRSRVAPDQTRVLTFTGQPILIAAETIALVAGRDVRVDQRIAMTPFTGVIRLTGDTPRDMAHLARLTGMRVSNEGVGWIIAPSTDPAR